jgi:hypothetical protein
MDDLTHILLEAGKNNYTDGMMMQAYKGCFIEGSALMVHPFSPDWYVGGSVFVSGRSSSIVEIGRFQFQRFTVSIKELAEWFGAGGCAAGGRMPGLARELNGQVAATLLSQMCRLFANRGLRMEVARAGDQWTVPEMSGYLACVG